jgi:hypothetical protein
MKNKLLGKILSVIFLSFVSLSAQENSVDIFVIDSYVTPEAPYMIRISFITSDSVKSNIIFNGKYKHEVSKNYVGNHKFEINLEKIKLDSSAVSYIIEVIDSNGNISKSDVNELSLPSDLMNEPTRSDFLTLCLGGTVFAIPNPTMVFMKDKKYFSLTKEIPFISFFSKGYNYPAGYISAEYSYIEKIRYNHFLRIGYKQIFSVPEIEFVSLGLNAFTDFKGKNGLSPELTIGIVRIYNIFTLFGRYRFNMKPNESEYKFHEVSIGLYSNFLSINF